MSDTPPPSATMPDIGYATLNYGGGVKMYKPACNTCRPPWSGKALSKKDEAMQAAVMHAIHMHGWVPSETAGKRRMNFSR